MILAVTHEPLVLVYAEMRKVLGEYDHYLTFRPSDEFIIIYGPNGVGKTKFLEIIHYSSRLDGSALVNLPFAEAQLTYTDGTVLTVNRSVRSLTDPTEDHRLEINFTLERPNLKRQHMKYSAGHFERWLVENTTWRPAGRLWEDRRDGELAGLDELEQRYPEGLTRTGRLIKAFQQFRDESHTFLIETQRLKIEQFMTRRTITWQGEPVTKHTSKISEQADKMKRLVNRAQTEHSRITQQLDRTFPSRVLGSSAGEPLDDVVVRQRYNDQNSFRSRLGKVAAVSLEDALSLPDRRLAPWELRLLSMYLDDTEKKLAPFVELLRKVELLEQIINSRLLRKRLQVTAGDGLRVVNADTKTPIDLNSLSSGEQHEIILMFDLLFNVSPGALVLIDEPEISLHVVWQMAFIPDVQRIAELAGFRFIVATHSPQIINDSWGSAVRLGPSEAAFS